MGYENENAFQNYLNNYDLKTEEIREKIKIETLWNELIYAKYASKININKDDIKQKSKKIFIIKNQTTIHCLTKEKSPWLMN